MSKKLCTALCLATLAFGAVIPAAASAVEDPATGTTGTISSIPADPADTTTPTTTEPLSPEDIAALQGAPTSTSDESESTFDKVSDFVTDNAPFIIIGIVVLAAILAGIFIMRGRNKSSRAGDGNGAPASVPSAAEIRRRKRAAMQRSREEERLRRKAGLEGRQASQPTSTLPLSANLPVDPVEAEKQSARDQLQAAAAVARSGAVPAPPSPSQTAPATGVVSPGSGEPDTAYTSGTPTPEELAAAAAAAAPPASPPAPEPVAPVPASAQDDP
ncbi:MAG: hypothetical protein M3Y23_03340, partial [Actinomycetota bacterium]|nr:hypothetical protein [Actinomycetota bacterium]